MIVPFMDLARQIAPLRGELDAAIARCVDRCSFIQGLEVAQFEQEFARDTGSGNAVGCGSGTDALFLALKALKVGPGQEVIVPALTFAATVEAVLLAGAEPVIVDVDADRGLLCVDATRSAVSDRTGAIIYVNLYGQHHALQGCSALARGERIPLIADAAQAHGARPSGRPLDDFADVTCYSFFPGKNLGAFGDAGACTTHDAELAVDIKRRRDHGRSDKATHLFAGVNMRMDEIQAAVLRVKLGRLALWNTRRREIAQRYLDGLGGLPDLSLPRATSEESVWHLFVVESGARRELLQYLLQRGIDARAQYPIAVHQQAAFLAWARRSHRPNAEAAAGRALALPLFESMTDAETTLVIEAVRSFFVGA